LKETAVAEAAQASSREEHMLQLMTDASLDMAGIHLEFNLSLCTLPTFPTSC
jgi:hypothetical protein